MTTNSCEFFTLYEDKIIESRNGVAILQKNLDKKINLLKSFFYKKTKGELILSPKISEDNIQYNLFHHLFISSKYLHNCLFFRTIFENNLF
jgi:hypothetical protein